MFLNLTESSIMILFSLSDITDYFFSHTFPKFKQNSFQSMYAVSKKYLQNRFRENLKKYCKTSGDKYSPPLENSF